MKSMIHASPPKPSFLANCLARFQAKMASPTGRLQSKADTPVLASWKTRQTVAAAAVPECPACGAECDQPLECTICGAECCPECAPDGSCKSCAAEEKKPVEPAVAPAAQTGSILQLPPPAAASVPLADGPARRLQAEAIAAAAAAAAVPSLPLPSIPPAVSTKPIQDLAFFEALGKTVTSNTDKWNVAAAIMALAGGEEPAEFIGQAERDEQSHALHLLLKSEKSNDEQWRIIKHLNQLNDGGNPGPFISRAVIDGRVAALEATLATETDSAVIWDTIAHIKAIKAGLPFVPLAERRLRQAELQAKLEASTSNNERFDLARQINALH